MDLRLEFSLCFDLLLLFNFGGGVLNTLPFPPLTVFPFSDGGSQSLDSESVSDAVPDSDSVDVDETADVLLSD
jgi:hypothetical protein